ncbi:hypothetical protein HYU15_04225 [Candidatus Woesearchaeota archaeon]|nr:hypothetical protein [Candidatus Woesearchaeota archaeon]
MGYTNQNLAPIVKLAGAIIYDGEGLDARIVVQHDIDTEGNPQGAGALEIVVHGGDGSLMYFGVAAIFESTAMLQAMQSRNPARAGYKSASQPEKPKQTYVYFSDENLPAEPAKAGDICRAAIAVYNMFLDKLNKTAGLTPVQTLSLNTAIADARRSRAAETAREASSIPISPR